MERLYCQGVVGKGYGHLNCGANRKAYKSISNLVRDGLRPKITLGCGTQAVKGFNARGVAISRCLPGDDVSARLNAIADSEIAAGSPLGKRQAILDDWIKEQNDG